MPKKKSKSLGLDQWVTFTTSIEQKDWLAAQTAATGVPTSRIIRMAIQAVMDKEESSRKR